MLQQDHCIRRSWYWRSNTSMPFLVRLCAVFFPLTSFSDFVLSKCPQPSLKFSHFLMARVSGGTDVSVSLLPASSSNLGSSNGSLPDFERTGSRPAPARWRRNSNEIHLQLPLFMQNAARIENYVQTLAQTVAAKTTKITSIEQIVGSLLARVSTLEAGAASCSSGPDSARSWNFLGQSDGSTATGSLGSHGPRSSDDNRNTRRRLDSFSSP